MKPINTTPFVTVPFVVELAPKRFQMTFVVKGSFRLVNGGMATLADEQAPIAGDEFIFDKDGSLSYSEDLVPFKPRSDVLVTGQCHQPGNQPNVDCTVGIQVGMLKKAMNVVGDRHWNHLSGRATDPNPFLSMPLCYERAWGGPHDKSNPVGIGQQAKTSPDNRSEWRLPNFEDPGRPIHTPAVKSEPIGLGPIPMTWEPRQSLAGTYDNHWLKNRWPFYPHDFDWGHFNAAPRDQQIDGYLVGNEQLVFDNLHPAVSRFHSGLPGVRIILCMYTERSDDQDSTVKHFQRVPMNLDTMWIDVGQESMVLIWRGVAEVSDDKASELKSWYVDQEDINEASRSDQDYYERFKEAKSEEDQANAVMTPEEAEAQNAQLQESLGPDAPQYSSNLAGQDLATQIGSVLAVAQQVEQSGTEKSDAQLSAQGIDPKQHQNTQVKARTQSSRSMGAHKTAWAQVDDMEQKGLPTHEAKSELHAQGLGPDPPVDQCPVTQEDFESRVQAGEVFEKADLTHLDLTGLKLDGAKLLDCYLAGVSLAGASLIGAELRGSLFGGADLNGADLSNADCSHAFFADANLEDAKLVATTLTHASFENAKLSRVDLSGASGEKAIFCSVDLTEAMLAESTFVGADFSKSCLKDANADGADLTSANFNSVQASRISLVSARLEKLRANLGAVLREANLQQAVGPASVWLGCELESADFSYSNMPDSFFMSANLSRANMSAAVMRRVRFCESSCQGASFNKADLLEADFTKADLTEADFDGANAFGATFMEATCQDTVFEHANLEMTSLVR